MNSTFDAETAPAGSPAPNVGFETSPTQVGTTPTNYGFGAGDLSSWISTGTVSYQTDAGNGYGRLGSTGTLKSTSFEVGADAQFLTFRIKGESAGSDQYKAYILSGTDFLTSHQVAYAIAADTWTTLRIDVAGWRGQTIKLKVDRFLGTVGLDDAGVGTIDFAGWTFTGTPERLAGGPTGAYAKTNVALTSPEFTLDPTAQQITIKVKGGGSPGTAFYVDLLHGTNFGTTTTLDYLLADANAWQTRTIGIGGVVARTAR